jgi:hypothetical protein
MGFIKYDGKLIFEGIIGEASTVRDGWCNSMEWYNPHMYVYTIENDSIMSYRVNLPDSVLNHLNSKLEVKFDPFMEDMVKAFRAKEAIKVQKRQLSIHSPVKVIKGRKVPIGTEGEIFWIGETKWGKSVGIRLIDDTRVFTSINNVEKILDDELFEKAILGSK